MTRYKPHDDKFIMDGHSVLSNNEIARHLNKPVAWVKSRFVYLRDHGYTFNDRKSYKRLQIKIKNLSSVLSTVEIASKMNLKKYIVRLVADYWTEREDKQLIKLHATKLQTEDIALKMGRSVQSVRSRITSLRNMGYLIPRKGVLPDEIKNKIKQMYQTMTIRQIAKELNLEEGIIKNLINRNKWKCGRSGFFRKGHKPWNDGMKGIHLSPDTEFKKGAKPKNTKYDGCVSIRRDKSGTPYKFIRVANRKWEPLHRYLWQQAGNVIPKGMLLTFKDGDSMNYKLSNLEVISRKENLSRNINREKMAASMRETWSKRDINGSKQLSDDYIVQLIAGKDMEMRQLIKEQFPDLIEIKRTSLLLRRAILKQTKQKK